MSSVIVLSDSDDLLSPFDKRNANRSEVNEKYNSDATSDFDFPEVPFCREIGNNLVSQNEDLNFNINNDYKHIHGSPNSSDSEDNRVEKTSRKATVFKKDKIILKRERLKRQQVLAREKALKMIEKKKSREIKPGECMKFMEVNLDRGIDEFAFQTEIKSILQNADVNFNITTELIPNSITWLRNSDDNYIDENNEVRVKKNIHTEKYTIVIWSNYQAIKHVVEGTFCASILNSKALIPNHNMTLVIFGIEEYFTKKQKPNNSSRSKGLKHNNKSNQQFETLSIISRYQLEMCLAEIQIVAKCSSRLIETAQDLALMIYQYTKSISEIPYKLQKKKSQESKFDWYVMGDNRDTVRVDKDGNGLKRLWQQQLCQFNLSSLETSEAICTVYPSPAQLIEVYKNCTPYEGINLLKDIPIRRAAGPLTTTRKIGPELSKKIYMMFTSQNKDALLGTEV